MSDEVWILGGTGRSGRAAAVALGAAGVPVVLVGRDALRLQDVSGRVEGARILVAGNVESMIDQVLWQRPAVVVNTVGPFATTAAPVARACLPAGCYVDLSNDHIAASAVLGLHDEAVAAGHTLVTGAGFGVLATESVVVRLCEGRPPAQQVRTDAVPSVALEAGVLGEALAGTIIDGVPEGGRRYSGGRLVRARVGDEREHLTLPTGPASPPPASHSANSSRRSAPAQRRPSSRPPARSRARPRRGSCSRSPRPC